MGCTSRRIAHCVTTPPTSPVPCPTTHQSLPLSTPPVYESLGPNAAEYILSHSEAKAVFVSSKKLGALAAALPKTGVTTVVYWGSASAEEIAKVPSTLKTGAWLAM